jgi:hypothetical protein
MDLDESWKDRWVPEKIKVPKIIKPTQYYEIDKNGKIK